MAQGWGGGWGVTGQDEGKRLAGVAEAPHGGLTLQLSSV